MATPQRSVRAVPNQPASQPRGPHVDKAINKSRAFSPSVNPTVNISVLKGGAEAAPAKAGQKGAPGGDFLSNEDIRAFCEAGRKDSRQRAVERSLDAEMLEGRLRNIPDTTGAMSGARARARRVTRWLKRIAQAEKMIAKWYAALYSAFEREYEAELMQIGKGRHQQKPHSRFGWR
ncbi:plasmid transfer protein TraA [Streptomyces sp. ODS28]|uniref:plasmid transfer protein TraA n=1 Tax=Streptomyces sp. ODS28 TaxID=3136688 RepID=UPI0031E69CDE